MSAHAWRLSRRIVVLVGTLAPSLLAGDATPVPVAPQLPPSQQAAPPLTTAASVAGLVQAAQHGDAGAGATLVRLGLADCLAGVDGDSPDCQAWMAQREGPIPPQQVYGIALAQSTLRQTERLGTLVPALLQRARAFACGTATAEPSALCEQALLWGTVAPADHARARALFLHALLLWPQPGEGEEPSPGELLRAARIAQILRYPERAVLRARAAQAIARLGPGLWQARWVTWLAQERDLVPGTAAGDAAATEARDLAAIHACTDAGDALARADAWALRVRHLRAAAGDDDATRAALIAAATAQAVALGEAGLPAAQALVLRAQAQLLGMGLAVGAEGWEAVARCEEAAGAAWDRAGDSAQAAGALAAAARAQARWDPLRANERARMLLRQAIQRYEQVGQALAAERLAAWFAPTTP